MSEPDIIRPLTADPAGPKAWCWIAAVEITRQGNRSVSGIPQLGDKWRINLPMRQPRHTGRIRRGAPGGWARG